MMAKSPWPRIWPGCCLRRPAACRGPTRLCRCPNIFPIFPDASFNQAHEIAPPSCKGGAEYGRGRGFLRRIRHNRAQASLDRKERMRNACRQFRELMGNAAGKKASGLWTMSLTTGKHLRGSLRRPEGRRLRQCFQYCSWPARRSGTTENCGCPFTLTAKMIFVIMRIFIFSDKSRFGEKWHAISDKAHCGHIFCFTADVDRPGCCPDYRACAQRAEPR